MAAVGSAYHLLRTSHRLDHQPHSLAKILAASGEPAQEEEEEEEGVGTCSISEPKRTRRTNSPPSSCDRCNMLLPRRREKTPCDRVLRGRASPVLAAVIAVPIVIIMAMQSLRETTRNR